MLAIVSQVQFYWCLNFFFVDQDIGIFALRGKLSPLLAISKGAAVTLALDARLRKDGCPAVIQLNPFAILLHDGVVMTDVS